MISIQSELLLCHFISLEVMFVMRKSMPSWTLTMHLLRDRLTLSLSLSVLCVCVSLLATICMFCVCELATFFSARSIKANTKTLCFSITFAYLLQLILLLQHVLKYILVSELISLHSHSAEALRHNVPMQWMCQDYHSGKVSTLARCWEH